MRSRLSWLLLICCAAVCAGRTEAKAGDRHGPDFSRREGQIQAAFRRLIPTIVEIQYGRNALIANTGVIVSADGLILASSGTARRVLDEKELRIRLSDGTVVGGRGLGWSSELRVGLLKIRQPGPWPYAELGDGMLVHAGDLCLGLGYQHLNGVRSELRPAARLGQVTRSAPGKWFNSSCLLFAGPYSVFDLQGRLVGVTTYIRGSEPHHVNITRIREHWDQLLDAPSSEKKGPPVLSPGEGASRPGGQQKADDERKAARAAVIGKARKASVKIVDFQLSGTIVTADGYVVTCEHNQGLPGQEVTLELSTGQMVKARLVGIDATIDVGLIKIIEDGPWPFVPMGESRPLKPGDWCVKIGYPIRGDEQVLVTPESHKVLPSFRNRAWRKDARLEPRFWTKGSAEITQGASGGGVFDEDGRLVGVTVGKDGNEADSHVRIEFYRKHWNALSKTSKVERFDGPPLPALAAMFARVGAHIRPAIVQVHCDGQHRALGSIVRADGLVLTKLSELKGAISCRLSDGRRFPATVERTSEEHDLALLKIDARELPRIEWSSGPAAEVGTLIHAVVWGKPLPPGVVGRASRPAPRVLGDLGVRLAEGEPVTVAGRHKGASVPLRKGDVLLRVNDEKVETSSALYDFFRKNLFAGEKVRLDVQRDGRTIQLEFEVPAVSVPSSSRLVSSRWWGYPRVMGTEIPFRRRHCGGPVIDRHGKVVGIAIACRADYGGWGLRHILPAEVARSFVFKR